MTLTPLITEDVARRVAKWRAQGYTFATIGKRLGISTKTAQRAIFGREREDSYHDKQMERLADIPTVEHGGDQINQLSDEDEAAEDRRIAAAMEAIKAKWTDEERERRVVGTSYVPAGVHECGNRDGRVIRTAIK